MVSNNTDPMDTAFTVSVDLKGFGVTSGISASDRSKTIKAIVDNNTKPDDLARPGHIFPLIAKDGGVLRRTGHTEAAIDFARLAGCSPAGVICEIMSEDGSMARVPELIKVAKKLDLKIEEMANIISSIGCGELLITSIDRDGSGEGYDLEGYNKIAESLPKIPKVIAGGAISTFDIDEAAREDLVSGVAAGNMFHFTENIYRITKKSLKAKKLNFRCNSISRSNP